MRTPWVVTATLCSMVVTVLSLETMIAVQRGRTADLSAAIASSIPRHCSRVQYVEETGLSCGSVYPSQFDCSHNSSVVYQHYGCLSSHEIVNFQLSILPNNFSVEDANQNVVVRFFSVEVVIEDSQSPLSKLTLYTQVLPSSDVAFRVEFPRDLVGRCHYQLVTSHHLLPLPLAGQLHGTASSHTFPCGYAPKNPLHYVPNRESKAPRDYVMIRVSSEQEEVYVILEVWRSSVPLLPNVLMKELVVQGTTYTPIPDHLFLLQDRELQYKYIVPLHSSGRLVFLLSPSENQTVFTSAHLRAGLVSYHSRETLTPTNSTLHYTVADLAGTELVQGAIALRSLPESWSLSQRTNKGLSLAQGGTTAVNSVKLDFYMLGVCVDHSTVTLVQPPRHGVFFLHNNTNITNTTIPLNSLRNSSVVYRHSGDEVLADNCVWEFFCPLDLKLVLSFDIRIASLGGTPPHWAPGHTLTTYHHLAVPLSHLPLFAPDSLSGEVVIHVVRASAGSLVKVKDSDRLYAARTPFPPYLNASQISGSAVVQFTLADTNSRTIWYLPPSNTTVDTLHLTAQAPGSPPHTTDEALISVLIATGRLQSVMVLSTEEAFPRLLRNNPLPLHSHLPVYISPRFLYSQVPQTLASSIVYVVKTPPTHGVLCLSALTACTSSLSEFTQKDINREHVIYQPARGALSPDMFEFVVTLHGVPHHNHSRHFFQIHPVPQDLFSSGRQFWIKSGGKKPVAARYFRPYSHFLGKKTEFFLTSHPQHGSLLLDNAPHPANFSFQNLLERRLSYQHHGAQGRHCSDTLSFTASNGTHHLQGTLEIAVAKLVEQLSNLGSGSHHLFGQTSFVFHSAELPVSSTFCAQFVQYLITTPPCHGVLQLYNTQHNTVLQLGQNSTFTAEDVQAGLLRYSLVMPKPLTQNISDKFAFKLSDPNPNSNNNAGIRTATPSTLFQIYFVLDQGIWHNLSIYITAPRPLTWLQDHREYGYVLGPEDIDIRSETVLPTEIIINVEQPKFGSIRLNDTRVSHFTLEQLHAGWVRYQTTLRHFKGLSQDIFWINNVIVKVGKVHYPLHRRYNFTVEWCTISIEWPSYTVAEEEENIQIVLRRDGASWFQSNVTLTNLNHTASPCTSSPLTIGDYCSPPQVVTFDPGETKIVLLIPITNDTVAEDTENFTLSLSSPTAAVLTSPTSTTVWITDFADYATLGFVGPPAVSDPSNCEQEVRVQEGVGVLSLNISRTGNLEQTVDVVCYTEAHTASRGEDFRVRPNSARSRVVFSPFQTMAQCQVEIVDDILHESKERFLMHLGGVRGRATIDAATSPLCVYLIFDINDVPVVSFNTSELTVRENETSEVLIHFKILRAGVDLTSRTSVYYQSLSRPHDRATPGEDFALFTSGVCGEGVGCVDFASSQTEVELAVRIIPDTLREGNESFHLYISDVRNGKRGQHELLRITIIDAAQPAIVGFTASQYWFRERDIIGHINITRTGFIRGVTTVSCIRKPGNATSASEDSENPDFIAGDAPSDVTFQENETVADCGIYVYDDSVYEGPEDLIVRLDTNSTWVVLGRALARFIITDEEDAPMVSFSQTHYSIAEPLSNFPLDRTTLTLYLTRTGDTSRTSIVFYSTVNGTARAGVDFVAAEGQAVFLPGENSTQLVVQVLANHARENDSSFLMELMTNSSSAPTSVSQEGRQAQVEVRNLYVTGVYFPALPVVVSLLEDGSYQWGDLLDPNTPLLCVTPCDIEYRGDMKEQYAAECLRQPIDPAHTVYQWELSLNGTDFSPVRLNTVFTTSQSRILQPVYLQPGMLVRCSTRAVDRDHTRGYSRTSHPSQLSQQQLCEGRSGDQEALLVSYPVFSGAPEDLVQLTITLPFVPNSLPLLSTRGFSTSPFSLLTGAASHSEHPCSNFPSFDSSFLQFPSLYDHFNSPSCLWQFHTWLPVHTLQDECRADLTSSQISVSVHVVYVHIQINGSLVTSGRDTMTANLSISPAATPFRASFDILPLNHTNAFVFPVSLSASDHTTVEVYFYSTVTFPGHFLPSPHTALLHTNGSTQAWLARLPYSRSLSLQLLCAPDNHSLQYCAPNETYTFPLHLLNHSLIPTITTHATLLHNGTNSEAKQNGPFYYNEMVYGRVVVDSSYRLRPNHSLMVFKVLLCQAPRPPSSCMHHPSKLTILDVQGGGIEEAEFLSLGSSNETGFQFRLTMIPGQEDDHPRYIHIVHGLSNGSTQLLHALLPLPLCLPPSTPTIYSSTPSPSSTPTTPSIYHLYAVIAILATAVLVVGVACVLVTLLLWWWRIQQRQLELKKREEENKQTLNSDSDEQGPPHTILLRRTRSTTGFPTTEKLNRHTTQVRPPASVGHPPPTLPPVSRGHLPFSKSLPNLALLNVASDDRLFPESEPHQRRSQHKPQTRVKILNTEHSSLNSWSRALQAHQDLGTVKIINELAASQKSYGVNDLGGREHQRGEGGRRGVKEGGKNRALACYAVHSLAASANTPEPGSLPNTEL